MMRILALLGLVALTSSLSLSFSSSSSSFTGKSFSSPQVTPPSATSPTTMKLFDWKRREADESLINDMENTYLTLTNLKPAPGSKHRKSRKGRGIAAGQGASCGFGMRGQKSRSGSGVSARHEATTRRASTSPVFFTQAHAHAGTHTHRTHTRRTHKRGTHSLDNTRWTTHAYTPFHSHLSLQVRPGFEGGQQPLYRRLPKWPGRTMGPGHKRTIYNIIKTDELNSCKEGDVVNYSVSGEGTRS